jgi:hypothetical protein
VRRLAKVAVAFVAGAATLTVTLFQVHDRIWPPVSVHGGEVVSADLVQVGVSYGAYVRKHPRLIGDTNAALEKAGDRVNEAGAVVDVVLRMEGLRGRHCRVEYTVYRSPLTPVIGPTEALAQCTAHVQDGDEGGWPAWVELPQQTGRDPKGRPVWHRYFVRFDLYDEHGLLIGPSKNTPVFGWNGEQMAP